jgi:hypothetical protein
MGLDLLRFATFLTHKRVDIARPDNYDLAVLARFFTGMAKPNPLCLRVPDSRKSCDLSVSKEVHGKASRRCKPSKSKARARFFPFLLSRRRRAHSVTTV